LQYVQVLVERRVQNLDTAGMPELALDLVRLGQTRTAQDR
jgi:hypothetical protein